MKKFIAVLLALSMMLTLTACGGSAEPQSTPAPEAEAPAPQATIEIAEDAGNQDIAITALQAFLAEDVYGTLVADFEEATQQPARELEITAATEYTIPDFEGTEMHLLMVNGAADVMTQDDTIYDRIILLVDLDTGAVYDQYSIDMNSFDGDFSTYEGRVKYCLGCYNSYLMGDNDGIMTNPELEVKTDLSTDEIAAINEAIRPQSVEEDLGGYGGPGEDYVEEETGYILAFSNEEEIYPSEVRTITTDEGFSGDYTVYMIPAGTEIYVESYEDNVLINLVQLEERESGPYWPVGIGCLAGDNTWVPEDSRVNAGSRYTITFDDPGMWEIIGVDGNGSVLYYFFEVQA